MKRRLLLLFCAVLLLGKAASGQCYPVDQAIQNDSLLLDISGQLETLVLEEFSSGDTLSRRDVLTGIHGVITRPWNKSGWTLIAILSLIVAVASLVASLVTTCAQIKTRKNTDKPSLNMQMGILDDLQRHLYRNLVCTISGGYLYQVSRSRGGGYPSESLFRKLPCLVDDILLPIKAQMIPYRKIYELKYQLKNYGIDALTLSEHLQRKEIDYSCIVSDFESLYFKPLFLIKNILQIKAEISGSPSSFNEMARIILSAHFRYLSDYMGFLVNEGSLQLLSQNYSDGGIILKKREEGPKDSIDRAWSCLLEFFSFDRLSNFHAADAFSIEEGRIIMKQAFLFMLFDEKEARDDKRAVELLGILTKCKEKERFFELMRKWAQIDTLDSSEQWIHCWDVLQPYLRLIQSEKIDFYMFFRQMLVLEAAIEYELTGSLVNYVE